MNKIKEPIVIKYYGDPTKMVDDHDSDPVYLVEVVERRFENIFEAIRFLDQCIDPITKVEDIVEIENKPKGFKFILSDRNIKIKHQANNNLDINFLYEDLMDTWK